MEAVAFSDRLLTHIREKKSVIVAGLDPEYLRVPLCFRQPAFERYGVTLKAAAEAIIAFNKCIIDIVAPVVPAIKPQIAFYEMYGLEGIRAFVETVNYAKNMGLIVIEDAKRNDIGNTAKAYSHGHIGCAELDSISEVPVFAVDALTINPYLGSDGITPFLDDVDRHGKGIFILVKTSNPSSAEIQDLVIQENNRKVYEFIAEKVNAWGEGSVGKEGYSSVGAVVGATFPEHARILRSIMPHTIFLVPGYGAQGGKGQDVVPCFNDDGYGAIVSASRSIIYPHKNNMDVSRENFKSLVKTAVENMNIDINEALMSHGLKFY